jgi:hypothetical protein
MLAFTHHFIVQLSAFRALYNSDPLKFRIFTDYALLGDDLVLANKKVKDAYLCILRDLGVKVGLHKSILSSTGIGLEFAKRTFVLDMDVSPISFKEFFSALDSTASFTAFSRKYNLSFPLQIKILGYGFRVLGRCQDFFALPKALKALFLSRILKSNINSDSLMLSKSFKRVLTAVGSTSLVTLFFGQQILRLAQQIFRKIILIRKGAVNSIPSRVYYSFEESLTNTLLDGHSLQGISDNIIKAMFFGYKTLTLPVTDTI